MIARPGLLAFEREGEAAIRVFVAPGTGRRDSFVQNLTPFMLLADPQLLKSWTGKYDIEKLAGEGFYTYLVRFQSWSDLEKARTHCTKPRASPPARSTRHIFSSPIRWHST